MARPSKSTPERAAQGVGKQIPIKDATEKAEQPRPSTPTDTGDPNSPSSDAAQAVPADPEGSAAGNAAVPDASTSDKAVEDTVNVSADDEVLEGESVGADVALSADEQVAKAQAEAKEWQDKFLRLHAEWDTYRRRTAEQREVEKARAAEKLVTSLIPVIDDFERTIDYAVKNGETGLLDGVNAVHAKLVDVLKGDGVQVIDPAGEAFDALEAQAVATVEDVSVPDETVGEVYQKGYKMGSKVLRPAMVTVTTGGPKREVADPLA